MLRVDDAALRERFEQGTLPPGEFERCPQLFARARALVGHYSSELLDSAAARAGFVEPDRVPLPHTPDAANRLP